MLQMISIFFASGLHFKLITFSLVTTKLYFMQFFINRDWSDHQNHYEYSYAILLHVQGILSPPTSGMGMVSMRVDCIQKSSFYASLWGLAIQE